MKSPFTCNHENLKLPIAGGARECKDCGHILSNYTLGQLDRAEIAEADCKMANQRIEELEGDLNGYKAKSLYWKTCLKMRDVIVGDVDSTGFKQFCRYNNLVIRLQQKYGKFK